jgi:hypothetical protein
MINESKIIITKDSNDEWDIDIHNVNVNYLPELLGNVLADAFDAPVFNPMTPEQIIEVKKVSLAKFAQKLGIKLSDLVSSNWIELESQKPEYDGPFICVEASYPDKVYANMYWDSEKQMFGTRDGNGYAFITHWQEVPKFQ